MSTIIPFTPSNNSNFQFQVAMDGSKYNCVCTWNMFGQRYYISMFDINNIRVFTLPIIASTNENNINIAGGYFTTSSLIFRGSSQQFEVLP